MKFFLLASLISLSTTVNGNCAHVTFEKGFITEGKSIVVLQDAGHRFYKKFSGKSDIYAIINSKYLDGKECVAFDASLIDPNSSIGIYNYSNENRTVPSDAAIYYYPTVGIGKSYSKANGTNTLEINEANKPVKVKALYNEIVYKINQNTGMIGIYFDDLLVT